MNRSDGRLSSCSESLQTDRRTTPVRPPPPVPPKPDQRGKTSSVKRSCSFSPEPVRTGPSHSEQHLYEDISELLDGLQHSAPPVPAIRSKKCVPGSLKLVGMNPESGERPPLSAGPHSSCQNYYNRHVTVSEDMKSSWKGNILNVSTDCWDSRDFEKTLKRYVAHLPFCASSLQRQTAELKEVADGLDKTHKGARIAGITGGTTGAVGGVAAVAGILLAPATLGASLAVTAVGIGVAAAGGVTGASAAITKKVKKKQVRKKVESILKEYQREMNDIEVDLNNIRIEMGKLKGVMVKSAKTARLVEIASGTSSALGLMNRSSGVIQGFALGMDIFFSDKDSQKLKKESKTKFAQKIREVADQIQAGLTELMDVREKLISEGI